ncbi:uncharacterized protein LOC114652905 isoform X2 [Erpetoichthys calabaricus]|uniref:uncharacterized protein LOC114652905 isoform X1 n=1 Tax=Erpetoichthys calabaricus TaxID=27687 RepID=UPI0022347EC1|nr:uncharacterized protein LOC114652905 isoform X1 [Erpetoichthys calabaricus]XP_051784142.1 uncharacterized protein LOC114652905 isoform X2 [Erpetoichthys calabaricus]
MFLGFLKMSHQLKDFNYQSVAGENSRASESIGQPGQRGEHEGQEEEEAAGQRNERVCLRHQPFLKKQDEQRSLSSSGPFVFCTCAHNPQQTPPTSQMGGPLCQLRGAVLLPAFPARRPKSNADVWCKSSDSTTDCVSALLVWTQTLRTSSEDILSVSISAIPASGRCLLPALRKSVLFTVAVRCWHSFPLATHEKNAHQLRLLSVRLHGQPSNVSPGRLLKQAKPSNLRAGSDAQMFSRTGARRYNGGVGGDSKSKCLFQPEGGR